LSITSYYSSQNIYGSTTLFYIAIVVENIFFTLGLGAKQKKLLIDKNEAQESVIEEHRINLELQEIIKSKLDIEVQKQTKKIIELTKENQLEEKRKLKVEYARRTLDLKMRALQTQMNPHFLFNSLNSIKHFIITNKKEDASYFLSRLSQLLRKILDNSKQKDITLKEELEIMQLYIEVENIRLHQQIDFRINIADAVSTTQLKIPPIILQPFIENAIWHGLALKKGIKKISIEIKKESKAYLIYIADNGIGREKSAILKKAKLVEKESLGISLTKERLEAYTEHLDGKVTITFEDLYENDKPTGTKVLLYIPIE
jgi:LytS/YehU family sensor histidine kinase